MSKSPRDTGQRSRNMSAEPYRILFVCTGNSARSQLAEGLANHLGAGQVEAQSAGTFPIGVNSYAVEVLKEREIDAAGQYSKGLDEVIEPFDLIVTLCDSAVKECPPPLLSRKHEHWSTPDPSFVGGGPDAVRDSFREVRDRLEGQIKELINRVRPDGGDS